MSRRYNAKRKARRQEARVVAKQPRRPRTTLTRRLVPVIPVVAIAAAFAATAVLGLGTGGGASRKQVEREVTALLASIPQDGITLGSSEAPITLQMFGDLACPTVKLFVENYLPSIIGTWVRAGTLNLTYHSLETDTDDERTFFRQEVAALAAGRQDRMWNFVLTAVREPGQAYTDYATNEFLTGIATQVPGLKREQWRDDLGDPRLMKRVALGVHFAHARDMSATPSFLIRFNGSEIHEPGVASVRKEFLASFRKDFEAMRDEAFKDKPKFSIFTFN
jgi:protein-disulfide isomerase